MERVFGKKSIILIVLVLALVGITTISFAANDELWTTKNNIQENNVLKFKGTSWNVYANKTNAKKADAKTAVKWIQNGDTVTVLSVAKDCNVLKVKVEGKKDFTGFIHYGSDAHNYFEKTNAKVTKITLKPTSLEFKIDKSQNKTPKAQKIKATLTPKTAKGQKITWTSENKKVATVDENGNVTAVDVGETVITAKAGDKEATCKVTVLDATKLSFDGIDRIISINYEAGKVLETDYAKKLKNVNGRTIVWTSSNEKVATVKDGKVTINKDGKTGTTIIKAYVKGNEKIYTQFKITVLSSKKLIEKDKVTAEIAAKSATKGNEVEIGKIITLHAEVKIKTESGAATKADKGSNKRITWTSSDTSIATVNQR